MPAAMHDDEPIRASGLLLRREAGGRRRWLLLRNRKRGEWGFPKGHAEAGEDDIACALRECAEETGIALVALDGAARILRYRLGGGALKQVVYLPARTAQERVVISHEHDRAGWYDARGVLERMPYESLRSLFRSHLRDFRFR
jgi:bis(5'-nucleosidyl)-tetraphosphatase